jgi:hypothetical protein
MREFELPHLIDPGQTVFAVKVVQNCPHDKTPSLENIDRLVPQGFRAMSANWNSGFRMIS